jgi:hypothetical protein
MRPNPENAVDIIKLVLVFIQKYFSANIVREDELL